jgi:hypothetical protein
MDGAVERQPRAKRVKMLETIIGAIIAIVASACCLGVAIKALIDIWTGKE